MVAVIDCPHYALSVVELFCVSAVPASCIVKESSQNTCSSSHPSLKIMGSQSLLVFLNQYLKIWSQPMKEANQGMTEELDDQQWLVVLV